MTPGQLGGRWARDIALHVVTVDLSPAQSIEAGIDLSPWRSLVGELPDQPYLASQVVRHNEQERGASSGRDHRS